VLDKDPRLAPGIVRTGLRWQIERYAERIHQLELAIAELNLMITLLPIHRSARL